MRILWCLIGLATGVLPMAADEMVDRLIDLRKKRDEAVARATAEVDAKYRLQLQKLLSEAVSNEDRKAVERIRAEMSTIGMPPAAQAGDGGAELEQMLLRSRWEWWAGAPGKEGLRKYGDIGFAEDGKLIVPGGLRFLVGWKLLEGDRFEIKHVHGTKWLFELDRGKARAISLKGKGYIGDNKEIRQGT